MGFYMKLSFLKASVVILCACFSFSAFSQSTTTKGPKDVGNCGGAVLGANAFTHTPISPQLQSWYQSNALPRFQSISKKIQGAVGQNATGQQTADYAKNNLSPADYDFYTGMLSVGSRVQEVGRSPDDGQKFITAYCARFLI